MKVQLLIDNINSWILPYAKELEKKIVEKGHQCSLIHLHKEVQKGDVLVLLSCERIFKNLSLNTYNLVIHESDLPKGKGWSPLTWQILEGKNEIPITLFEAAEDVDSGVIYEKVTIHFNGTELLPELKHKQGIATIELILKFIQNHPNNVGIRQEGDSSFYPKRTPDDSRLSTEKTIEELFNALRVADNERYPAYFEFKGKKYYLKITKDD